MDDREAGKRLEKARAASGMSLHRVAAHVLVRLDRYGLGCSLQTIRNYELGKVPERDWNPLAIAALASVYGVETSDLSELAANRVSDLLSQSFRWNRHKAA